MPMPSVLTWSVLLTAFLSCVSATNQQPTTVQLCSEVHGFAGEQNSYLSIPVGIPASPAAPIVLSVFPYPFIPGELAQKWVQLNASYVMEEGLSGTAVSDDEGVLFIESVAPNTKIDVWVHRVHKQLPVPFRLYSYQTNMPTCYLPVTPYNTFTGSVLTNYTDRKSSAEPLKLYFSTGLPAGYDGFVLSCSGNFPVNDTFQASKSPDGPSPSLCQCGEKVSWTGNTTAYIIYAPAVDNPASLFLQLGVSWVVAEGGGTATHSGSPWEAVDDTRPGAIARFWGFATVALWIILGYFAVMITFNIFVRGATSLPQCVPHYYLFQPVAFTTKQYTDTRFHGGRGGYASLDTENEYDFERY